MHIYLSTAKKVVSCQERAIANFGQQTLGAEGWWKLGRITRKLPARIIGYQPVINVGYTPYCTMGMALPTPFSWIVIFLYKVHSKVRKKLLKTQHHSLREIESSIQVCKWETQFLLSEQLQPFLTFSSPEIFEIKTSSQRALGSKMPSCNSVTKLN